MAPHPIATCAPLAVALLLPVLVFAQTSPEIMPAEATYRCGLLNTVSENPLTVTDFLEYEEEPDFAMGM